MCNLKYVKIKDLTINYNNDEELMKVIDGMMMIDDDDENDGPALLIFADLIVYLYHISHLHLFTLLLNFKNKM